MVQVTTSSSNLVTDAAGAFFGALFAFCFFLVSDHLTRTRTRQRQHHTALITLEYRLNDCLGVIADDIYLIEHFRQVVEKGAVHWSLPRPLPLEGPPFIDLLNLEVINEYFSLSVDFRKINDDLQNLVTAYEKMADRLASRVSPPEEYKVNALSIADGLEVIGRALKRKEPEIQRLVAKARVLAKKDAPSNRLLWWSTCSAVVTKDEVDIELRKLEEEIADTREKSRAEISRLLGADVEGG